MLLHHGLDVGRPRTRIDQRRFRRLGAHVPQLLDRAHHSGIACRARDSEMKLPVGDFPIPWPRFS